MKFQRPRGVEFRAAGDLLPHVLGQSHEIHVAGQAPLFRVLDEGDVAPGGTGELSGIVVRVARQLVAVGRELVPLLAGHLAGLAADADGGVCQESCRH
jgi:hypothetical protein